ncbi:hypothetical protein BJX66DRAFT_289799 [Aspergillus keveii]|uniref:Uncharacterized protein n=1 Tax=Aspergillus keveii TaxID=714993 RepID=A0ABR4GRD6_9EURO
MLAYVSDRRCPKQDGCGTPRTPKVSTGFFGTAELGIDQVYISALTPPEPAATMPSSNPASGLDGATHRIIRNNGW